MKSIEPQDTSQTSSAPRGCGAWIARPKARSGAKVLLQVVIVLSSFVAARSGLAQEETGERPGLFVVGEPGHVAPNDDVSIAVVIGGDLQVNGRVRGLALAVGGNLDIEPGGLVEGTGIAVGGTVNVSEDARVVGAQMQVAGGDLSAVVQDMLADQTEPPPLWLASWIRPIQVLALLVAATLVIWLFPEQVRNVRRAVGRRPLHATLVGLALLVGFVPACVVLGLTLFGIPLIGVAVAIVSAAVILGLTGLMAAVGRALQVVKNDHNLFGAAVAGFLLLALLSALPVVGGIVLLLAGLYGAGATLLSTFGTRLVESPTRQSDRPGRGQPEAATQS